MTELEHVLDLNVCDYSWSSTDLSVLPPCLKISCGWKIPTFNHIPTLFFHVLGGGGENNSHS